MNILGRPKDFFVGRQTEQTAFRATLNDVVGGQGQLVMLVGEPGIGKTRTAKEMTSHADAVGVRVLWGRCYEGEGAPPYWPWVQTLRQYVHSTDPDKLASVMGLGAPDIAEIVPEVHEILPNLSPSPALEADQSRFRLFNSIAAFLQAASQSHPLMILLDDLHWADRSSLPQRRSWGQASLPGQRSTIRMVHSLPRTMN